MISKEQLQLLEQFVGFCKAKPSILNLPELRFYREWLERFVSLKLWQKIWLQKLINEISIKLFAENEKFA